MTPRTRLILFFIGAIALAIMLALAYCHLPGPEPMRDRYAWLINNNSVPQRNATDAVTAVNFDYRGFDTLGEEFILFVSVMGALILLRQATEKNTVPLPDALQPGRDVGPSDATRLWILAMVGPKVLFGIYIVIHGQLTPGGGFQGGVILATVPLIIYLGENFTVFRKITSHKWVEIIEGIGAAGYGLIGFAAYLYGKEFLTNVLPMGTSNSLTASGTIPLISLATGIEVTGGFVLLLYAFLQELLHKEEDRKDTEGGKSHGGEDQQQDGHGSNPPPDCKKRSPTPENS